MDATGLGSLRGPLAVSLSLFLRLPYLWFSALELSWWGGGVVNLPKPKATFSGDVVKGQCTLTHLIYPKILDMSGLRL